jgi:hypothetical protein
MNFDRIPASEMERLQDIRGTIVGSFRLAR